MLYIQIQGHTWPCRGEWNAVQCSGWSPWDASTEGRFPHPGDGMVLSLAGWEHMGLMPYEWE